MDEITIVFIAFAICEGLQVYLLLRAVRTLRQRVLEILPPGKQAGEILSEAAFGFMDGVASDPKKQEAFFGFIGACAIAGWAQVQEKIIPGAKAGASIEGAVDKIVSKNPWAALAVEGARVFLPMIAKKAQDAQPPHGPSRNSKW